MISAPSPPQPDGLQRKATRFVVLFGLDDGSRPTMADEVDWLEPVSCRISAGAARVDAITLKINFPKAVAAGVVPNAPSGRPGGTTANGVLQDIDTAFAGTNNIVEIRATDQKGKFTRVVGWGKFESDSLTIDEHQEATVVARLDPYLFGQTLESYPLYSTDDDSAEITDVVTGDAGECSFTIAGDLHTSFRNGMQIRVTESTANDGVYVVTSAKVVSGDTQISVAQPVSDATDDGTIVWFPLTVEDRVVFNPLIDASIQGNMSSQLFDTGPLGSANYFLDPESVLTAKAQAAHEDDETASRWDMPSAVNFLCQWLNPDETYVQNPDLDALTKLFQGFDSSQLRNMSIPLGKHLPEALDLLLKPFGYWWYLANGTVEGDVDGPSESTITLFKRGAGEEKQVYLVRSGEPTSLAGTNLKKFGLERSLANMANVIDGCSSLGHFQCTLPLYPAWDGALNSTPMESLAKDQLTAKTHDIGRKWAVNEAGDYTTGYFGASRIAITTTDLSSVFGLAAAQLKRRVLKHCLSLDGPVGQGHSLGIWVEMWNPDAILPNGTSGGGWEKIAEQHAVLKRECGIWFEGDFPPELPWDYATKGPSAALSTDSVPYTYTQTAFPFGLRVTAVIEADIRTWSRGVRSPQSPNGADVTLTLDLSHKFPWRAIAFTGDYASQLSPVAGKTFPQLYAATPGKNGAGSLAVQGDFTGSFAANTVFVVTGSTYFNGGYTCQSASYDKVLNKTTLVVAETVPQDYLFDGWVVWNADIQDPLHPTSGVPITTYCQTLQNWQDAAQLNGSILLDDATHSEYAIGQVITRVNGRNLLLRGKLPASTTDDPRHPQLLGINYLFHGQQRMELVLESFKREEFPELEDKGEGRKTVAQQTLKHSK